MDSIPASVGVIGHIMNPTSAEAVGLAVAAEAGGAAWLGFADAFWWRDVWMVLGEVARATTTIQIGPGMTNPYLRHPFHTVAALATLQEIAGPRVMIGIAAGGSEVSGAAGVSRADAAVRIAQLAEVVRRVGSGGPLDPATGKPLEIPLLPVPVLIAGRGDAVLRIAGREADRVLVWAVPDSDLDRTVAVVEEGIALRADGSRPEIVWAPLAALDDADAVHVRRVAVYAALNGAPELRRSWGLSSGIVRSIRDALVRGDAEQAESMVPAVALTDLVYRPDTTVRGVTMRERARSIGATAMAVPGFDAATLAVRIGWACDVLSG